MISKLEVGDLDLDISEFDIVELIENVFELLEMKAEKKKITLSFENYHLLPNYVEEIEDSANHRKFNC
jgi:two-component system phosphate regulon sensor histidine kinase PhoR